MPKPTLRELEEAMKNGKPTVREIPKPPPRTDWPPVITIKELSSMWRIGLNDTRELVNQLYAEDRSIGMKMLGGKWHIVRDRALEVMGNGELQEAYNNWKGV